MIGLQVADISVIVCCAVLLMRGQSLRCKACQLLLLLQFTVLLTQLRVSPGTLALDEKFRILTLISLGKKL